LKSEGKYKFTYGKVEVRAKLTTGAGTWPAIWMLGSDYATNTWPGCGEIDIMEHKGSEPNVIHGTLHYPAVSEEMEIKLLQMLQLNFMFIKLFGLPLRLRLC
jgi:beta-glucanase (GH16 family)